jgi:PIN domain nuclease of toxin-antitoxin system
MPYVTDTHSLFWHVVEDPKLSSKAKQIFQAVDNTQECIFIPCIVFFELFYLIEKKKISADFDELIKGVRLTKNYQIEPLCLPIIERSRKISRVRVADPWDRLIAATAMHLNLPLITRDEKLKQIGLTTI